MAKAEGPKILFVGARSFDKKDKSRRLGIVEVVVLENGSGRCVQQFCDPALADSAAIEFAPLEEVHLEFEQSMGGRGVRSELVGVQPVAIAN